MCSLIIGDCVEEQIESSGYLIVEVATSESNINRIKAGDPRHLQMGDGGVDVGK